LLPLGALNRNENLIQEKNEHKYIQFGLEPKGFEVEDATAPGGRAELIFSHRVALARRRSHVSCQLRRRPRRPPNLPELRANLSTSHFARLFRGPFAIFRISRNVCWWHEPEETERSKFQQKPTLTSTTNRALSCSLSCPDPRKDKCARKKKEKNKI
jgi:hypothetical protein